MRDFTFDLPTCNIRVNKSTRYAWSPLPTYSKILYIHYVPGTGEIMPIAHICGRQICIFPFVHTLAT